MPEDQRTIAKATLVQKLRDNPSTEMGLNSHTRRLNRARWKPLGVGFYLWLISLPECLFALGSNGLYKPMKRAVGILHVKILRAKQLRKKDLLGAFDTYVGKHEKMAINVMLYAFRKVVIPGFGVDWSFLFLPMTAEVCYFSHSAGLVFLNRSNERRLLRELQSLYA
nr:synaptotagmin-1-like isoform X1 [Ipomoea batatas]